MSKLEVDTIAPQSGTTLTVGESGDTVTIPAGATLDASNATTTLPATVVTTTGSQTLTNKSIDASQLTGTITPSDNTVSLAKLTATGTKDATTFLRGDNTFAEAGGGKVLQVIQTAKTDTFTTTSTSFVDLTGLSASITPSSTSSKILVLCDIVFSITNAQGFIKLLRDSTDIYVGDSAGSRLQAKASLYLPDANVTGSRVINYLDSPSTTSSTTYKIQVKSESAVDTLAINRSQNDSDIAGRVRGTSSIILMEISA